MKAENSRHNKTGNMLNNQSPREILHQFYIDNNLDDDGGQKSSSVKVELTKKIHFYFPNFDARRKAVMKHDIHHLVTGYSTSLIGESEISAWEIASGCKSYWFAFFIDTSGFMMGLPINFIRVLKAFSRGRRTKNLYSDHISTDQAMDMKIGELKRVLELDIVGPGTKPTIIDFLLFSLFALFGLIYSLLMLPLFPFVLIYSIYIQLSKQKGKN
ncbi:MAG: uncharacterized protein K0S53_3246 [Bacteroidetes bacterium]|nr:uncharacterized protein [Bacteroidota bacterium]MDF2451129.1 uncharacterized protein [Bacteroidota bacterium]